jgi:glutamate racemase
MNKYPIGIFDSGFGGLTIMKEIVLMLPDYDYIYLGDNARAPYGPLDFDTVYQYTRQSVKWFFKQGCPLIILACNTASAKALRTIQQNDLPVSYPDKRVLGVIRPTAEILGDYSLTKHAGIMATAGTVLSLSYILEAAKFYPDLRVTQEACPEWVELVESGKYDSDDADQPVKNHIENLLGRDSKIDTVLLACTHYPLLINKIRSIIPAGIAVVSQGSIVADSLVNYLVKHPEIEVKCSRAGGRHFYTTGNAEDFNNHASVFFGEPIAVNHIDLNK